MSKAEATGLQAEKEALNQYIASNGVENAIQEVIQALVAAKPDNPKEWLLEHLEKELSNQSQDLSESDLHRLFAATQKITREIVPQDAIDSVIRETLVILNCDRVSLFVIDKKMSMLRLYASNLATPIMVSPGQGIVGSVFNQGQTVNIPDCYADMRFDKSFDQKTGYVTKSLIAVPIVDFEGNTVGVIQAINKISLDLPQEKKNSDAPVGTHAVHFERTDEKMLLHLTQHVGIAMRNAEVYREAIATSERSTGLLNTIQSLSQDLGTQSMLLTITMHASKIVSSERATVFLVDEPNQQLWSVSTDTGQEIRIPKKAGIAGQCCCEAKVINIPDAYADSRFNQEVDKKTGFKTQSILAIPMLEDEAARAEMKAMASKRKSVSGMELGDKSPDSGDNVIGVIQMINKVSFDGQLEIFDDTDVEVMELFAKFVGPKLAMSSMMAKRHAQSTDVKEAELALGASEQASHTHKRESHSAMMTLGEDNEEEEG